MLGVGVVCLALLLGGCGLGHAISGGTATTIQKHPFQVAIDFVFPLLDDDGSVMGENITMVCSGALITNKTVITAAVCAGTFDGNGLDVKTLRVRVGSQLREGGGEAYGVVDYQPHWYYREWLHERNVMLLYLEEEVTLRAEVRPITLATPATAPKAGEKLILSGYGDLTRDEVLEDGQVRQLRAVALPFVNQDLCESWYGFHYGHTNGCIGSGLVSVCGQADVGSPVVNWRGELVGVAINNVNYCNVPGHPAIFTNFAEPELNAWIVSNTYEKQPSPPPPTNAPLPTDDYCEDCTEEPCDPEYEECTTFSGDGPTDSTFLKNKVDDCAGIRKIVNPRDCLYPRWLRHGYARLPGQARPRRRPAAHCATNHAATMLQITWLVLFLAGCQTSYAIIGSSQTTIQKHPYTVAIDRVIPEFDDEDIIDYDISMMCAGALLSNKTVLVAASCFNDADDIKDLTYMRVRVGAQLREGGGEAFGVSSFLVHPLWQYPAEADNDVMLLYLSDEVPFRAEVQPVALTPPNAPAAGEKLIMTGYGDLASNEVLADGETRQIQVVTLPFVNQDLCEDAYYFYEGTTVSCAGGLQAGMCGWRDIGAPLVNWRGELVGVALQRDRLCGVPGRATTFTDLALPAINEWVRANVDVEPPPSTDSTAFDLKAVITSKSKANEAERRR
ncbi:uncharacterized protein LOC117652723 [Thrips palmi]|uniref:Uncharacterized protein LOC117652723 n=1 Tax=Thrips palmi TaxID=161013 RepID=A0A6P9ACX6_THRPL|nr:uncharacterized protein LOC117652723 [Thrips palmi]